MINTASDMKLVAQDAKDQTAKAVEETKMIAQQSGESLQAVVQMVSELTPAVLEAQKQANNVLKDAQDLNVVLQNAENEINTATATVNGYAVAAEVSKQQADKDVTEANTILDNINKIVNGGGNLPGTISLANAILNLKNDIAMGNFTSEYGADRDTILKFQASAIISQVQDNQSFFSASADTIISHIDSLRTAWVNYNIHSGPNNLEIRSAEDNLINDLNVENMLVGCHEMGNATC